jgi:hypothetical protein
MEVQSVRVVVNATNGDALARVFEVRCAQHDSNVRPSG